MAIKDRLKQNLAASWGSHVVAMAIGLFLMPYVLNVLGDNLYGTWIFINSFAGYTGLLYLGMGEMIARFVATHHARKEWDSLNESVSVVFFIYFAMGLVCLLIAGIVAGIAPMIRTWEGVSTLELRLVILSLGLNVAVGLVGSAFGGVLIGVQRYDIVRGFGVIAGLVRLVLTYLFLTQTWGLLTLSLIYLAVTITENLGPVWMSYRHVPTLSVRLKHFNKKRLRECFGFSAFTFLENLGYQIIYVTDSIVIGIVLGTRAIVPYFIASRLCDFVKKPIHQIGFISMPQAGALQAAGEYDRLQKLLFRSSGLAFLLTAGFLIGSAFFGAYAIEAWVGPGYDSSYPLLLVIVATQLIALPTGVMRLVLLGMGDVKTPCVLYFVNAVLNLGLSLLLIGPFGLMGVAVGTLVPMAITEVLVLVPYGRKRLHFTIGSYIKAVVAPYLIPLATMTGYCFLIQEVAPDPHGWLALFAVAAGGGVVLIGTWFVQKTLIAGVAPAEDESDVPIEAQANSLVDNHVNDAAPQEMESVENGVQI